MNSPLQPDLVHPAPLKAVLFSPETYDASEREIAASRHEPGSDLAMEKASIPRKDEDALPLVDIQEADSSDVESTQTAVPDAAADVDSSAPEPWREELAKRLNRYRARRQPREPRYPSLQLKFEPHTQGPISRLSFDGALAAHSARERTAINQPPVEAPPSNPVAENTARVIPFRRSSSAPPKPLEELAEPLQLFPRILDVPEVAPPPPALGGILIESEEEQPNPKRPGIEIPLQTSRISRRFLAAGIDGIVVFVALGIFAYIFFRITAVVPQPKLIAETAALVLGILWAGYQYLLLTYAGCTPGLKLAKLSLSQFDGNNVPRLARRWRALASILSALSLGLGYAWCMLDEDQLCWHDRITKTHLAPKR